MVPKSVDWRTEIAVFLATQYHFCFCSSCQSSNNLHKKTVELFTEDLRSAAQSFVKVLFFRKFKTRTTPDKTMFCH